MEKSLLISNKLVTEEFLPGTNFSRWNEWHCWIQNIALPYLAMFSLLRFCIVVYCKGHTYCSKMFALNLYLGISKHFILLLGSYARETIWGASLHTDTIFCRRFYYSKISKDLVATFQLLRSLHWNRAIVSNSAISNHVHTVQFVIYYYVHTQMLPVQLTCLAQYNIYISEQNVHWQTQLWHPFVLQL